LGISSSDLAPALGVAGSRTESLTAGSALGPAVSLRLGMSGPAAAPDLPLSHGFLMVRKAR